MLFLLQSPPAQVAPAAVTEVPFVLEGFLIVVEGKIDGKSVKLILDTGAGANLFTKKAAARLALKEIGNAVVGGGGESSRTAAVTLVSQLEVGSAAQSGQIGVIMDLPSGARGEFDGILGYPFLKNYIVQLDYAARRVRFLRPEQFSPDPAATLVPMRIRMNIPEIPARIDGLEGKVRVDTGYSGTLTFTSPTVQKNALETRYPRRIETVLGQGVGGVTRGAVTRIGSLDLGGLSLPGVITGLSHDKSGALADTETIALLGGEVLSRFTVTLDYPGQRFFLNKNASFSQPFIFARAGVSGLLEGEGYRILAVTPGGPAAQAGLKENEALLTLDGVAVTTLGLGGVRETLRRAPGTAVKATVRAANGQVRTVVLVLRDLL